MRDTGIIKVNKIEHLPLRNWLCRKGKRGIYTVITSNGKNKEKWGECEGSGSFWLGNEVFVEGFTEVTFDVDT